MAQYFSLSYTLPTPLRTVNVANSTQLTAAIADATPGDRIVLANGTYTSGMSIKGVDGTAANPIVFVAANSRQAIVSGSTGSRNCGISDSSYLQFYGIRFTAASVWGFTIGKAFSTDTDFPLGGNDIKIIDCEVDNPGQLGIKVNSNSYKVEIIGNTVRDTGQSATVFSEGVYIGDGTTNADRSYDILIQGNHIYNIGDGASSGEAIDIKVTVYNITVVDNLIENVVVNSQGAITALLNDINYPGGATDPNIVISRNIIHGVTKKTGGFNGSGISTGSNGILVTNNIIWDCEENSITSTTDASNTTGDFTVYNNTLWDGISVNASGVYGSNPVTLIQKNNLIKGSGSTGDDQVGVDADCVGPLTGTAISDTYTGSGYILDADSLANDAGIELAAVPDDVTGAARPSGAYSMGGYASTTDGTWSTATANITVTGSNGGQPSIQTESVTLTVSGPSAIDVIEGGVTGSARKALSDPLDTALSGANPLTEQAVFTSQDHSTPTYLRNTSFLLQATHAAALTCASPWNDAGLVKRAGTAVTKRHVLLANHVSYGIGTTVRFVAADNTVVDRSVVQAGRIFQDGVGTDAWMVLLDSDLPVSITPCKLFPADYATYLPAGADSFNYAANDVPLLSLDQEEKAVLLDVISESASSSTSTFIYGAPTLADRVAFYEPIIAGDSGNPVFAVIGTELWLLSTLFGAGSGPFLGALAAELDAMITTLDTAEADITGYTVTQGDLSSYTGYLKYRRPDGSSQVFRPDAVSNYLQP